MSMKSVLTVKIHLELFVESFVLIYHAFETDSGKMLEYTNYLKETE